MGRGNDLDRLLAAPIAHRGRHGGPGVVENSTSAALEAVRGGFGIECDIQLSRDGEAIVFHDDRLNRLTGDGGRVAELDAAMIGRLRLGEGPDHIPTLSDLLAVIDGRVPLVIEIKSAAGDDMRLMDRTLELLARYEGPAAIESFNPSVVLHGRGRRAPRPLGLVGPPETGGVLDGAVIAACDFLSWSIEDLPRIATLHPALPRTTWTIRTPEQADLAAEHQAQIVFEGFTPSLKRQAWNH